jgi:YbbR domain-containing protein
MGIRQSLRSFGSNAFGHLSTLLLSLIMGTIVWLIAINEVNPLVTQDFPETIPVEVRGLDTTQLQPIQDLSKEYVRLVLRAPRTSWAQLRPRDISAYIDLSGLGQGSYDVPIQIDKDDPNVDVVEVQRGQLRVQLDAVITKTISTEVAVMDNAAYGYAWQQPVISPTVVTILGPAAQVNAVTGAVAAVYLRGASSQVERFEELQLVNRQNQIVPNVTAQPSEVAVTIPVARWPGQRPVAVRVKLTGELAYGYRLGRVTATPSSVILYGPVNSLEEVPGVVETAPLPLDGAKENIRTTLDLKLPVGVNASEGNSVSVVAEILPVEDGRTITLKPLVTNLGPGLRATYVPDTVDVILSGPLNLLSSLGSDDVYVLLDVNGLAEGNYPIQPQVAKPNGIRSEGVLPETIAVVITSAITPTLSPGGTVPSIITPTITATASMTVTPTVENKE